MGQGKMISRLLAAVPPEETNSLLMRLIREESHADSPGQERSTAQTMADELKKAGIPCEWDEVLPNRFNLIARLPGCGNGPSLMLNGHLDTVPAYGMDMAFAPFIREGRMYGRGSVDMKGALAAMVSVLIAFSRTGIGLSGELMLAATVGEETYSPGAYKLASAKRPADYAIVGEPTELRIGIAHKGVAWYEAVFEGKSVHGSVPQSGVNAVYHAARWIERLRGEHLPELSRRRHPLLGSPTLNIGVIEGGTRPVIVPGLCKVLFERRLIPGESADTALEELRDTLAKAGQGEEGWRARVTTMDNFHGVPHGPLDTPASSRIVLALREAAEQLGITSVEPAGLPFWTDGALIGAAGTETVVCGPGRIEEAHSDLEYVELEQLRQAFLLYSAAACRICGVVGEGGGI
ncbi:M20 family metallopeptidase [Cohnella fermenti]|uniref:M20 family metallopeptidase n=1 Tax=Cohnella fermenti TaxID=2565925 RepID=UPI001454C13E|nr:M20 family metallopeptidase [Cohnella fermenti]